jgi:5'-3' exonuclease
MKNIIILIDLMNLIYIIYYTNYKVKDVYVYLYIILYNIIKYYKKFSNVYVYLCLESKKSFRKEIFDDYKKDRKIDEDLKNFLKENYMKLVNMLSFFDINVVEYEGLEADDLIYLLIYYLDRKNNDIYVFSNDSDLLQCKLINSDITFIDFRDVSVINKDIEEIKRIILRKVVYGDRTDGIKNIFNNDRRISRRMFDNIKSLDDLYKMADEYGIRDNLERNIKLILFNINNYDNDIRKYIINVLKHSNTFFSNKKRIITGLQNSENYYIQKILKSLIS